MKITIKEENLYIICILFILFVSATNKLLIYLGSVVLIITFFLINLIKLPYKNSFIPKLSICLLLFQNFCIGLGAHFGGNFSDSLSTLTQIPSLFVIITSMFLFVNKKLNKLDIVFLFFFIYVLLFLFIGNGVLSAELVYVRNFLIFYFGFKIGYSYLNSEKLLNQYINFFIKVCIIAAIFGLMCMIIGKSIYLNIGVLEVYKAKKYTAYVDGLPGNFRTLVNSIWVNRLASFYYDPVNFSYFMGLGVILAAVTKKKIIFIVLLMAEIFTFGKGGILLCLLTLVCLYSHKFFKKLNSKHAKRLILFLIIFGVLGLVFFINTFFADSFGTFMHFYGIVTAIPYVLSNPLGHGLGTAGNIVRSISDNGVYEISETGLLNMAYQIGIIGVIFIIIILLEISKKALKVNRLNLNNRSIIAIYIPFLIIIVSIFQENTFTPQCIIPYMILVGGICNKT